MSGWAAAPPTRCPGPTRSGPCSPHPSAPSLPTIPGPEREPRGRPPPPPSQLRCACAGRGEGREARAAGCRAETRGRAAGGRCGRGGWAALAVRDGDAGAAARRAGGEHGAESAAPRERKVSRVELVWLQELARARASPRARGCGAEPRADLHRGVRPLNPGTNPRRGAANPPLRDWNLARCASGAAWVATGPRVGHRAGLWGPRWTSLAG